MKPEKIKIAILGASSHIAMGLISYFSLEKDVELYLFARSMNRVNDFLINIHNNIKPAVCSISAFDEASYDVIINCIGIGSPAKLKDSGGGIFKLTETFDDLCINYLNDHNNTLYINFSSGAVYGKEFDKPADITSMCYININKIEAEDYYAIAKINSEAKHRSLSKKNIVDLRVFNYFSRYIDVSSKYLITEIIQKIQSKTDFVTSPNDIIRDYAHPRDLYSLVRLCIDRDALNDAFDVYSVKPIAKFELLDFFKTHYGLNYCVKKEDVNIVNSTGMKNIYYSINKHASEIGYTPGYSSLDAIKEEVKYILG
jgi:nucleoside-diphosphate-sugar epimerase